MKHFCELRHLLIRIAKRENFDPYISVASAINILRSKVTKRKHNFDLAYSLALASFVSYNNK
jgi:hypothetical protein